MRRRTWTRVGSAAGASVISPAWRAWMAESLASGVTPREVIASLAAHGVPAALAARDVRIMAASPALGAYREIAARLDALEQVTTLQRELARARPIERRPAPPADELYERYFAGNRPAVFTDVMDHWPARRLWSPAYFKEKLGDVELEIVDGRDASPDCDMRFEEHTRTMRMRDFADRVVSAGTTNDFYLIANNRALERPELRVLFDDVIIDETWFDPSRAIGASSLWFGPGGTLTPLHHDTSNILFCQVYGRKRVRLASPMETSLLEGARGFYARRPLPEDVVLHDVELSPGDALFIPVGWWHEVLALAPSINFSLLNFRRPNTFEDYRPGFAR